MSILRRVCSRLPLLLSSLALAILFAAPPASAQITDARGYDEDFVFSLASSGLSSAEIYCEDSAGERPPLLDPIQEFLLSQQDVGPYTDLDLTLQYQTSGGPFSITRTVQVNNDTHQILLAGNPASTLFDIFGPTPPPVSPTAVLIGHARWWVIILLRAIAAAILSGDVYITDQGRYVPTYGDDGTAAPDATDEANLMTAEGFVIGIDPNAANTVVRVQPASQAYDCHGFTFTKKFRWINDYEMNGATKGIQTVQRILDDNGYAEIPANLVRPGDIVVYRKNHPTLGPNKITHTGKVTTVKDNGDIIVESKWGAFPRYLHKPERVPASYGAPKYYRTQRTGHSGNTHFLQIGEPGTLPTPVRSEPTWGQLKIRYR
jgi:hypothetical protein